MGRRGRRHKQLQDGFEERREYYKLKEKALDRPLGRTCCREAEKRTYE
jgi:hypothetical protein